MFAEAEKQNEEIKRLARERARTWAEWNCLSKKWLKLACLKKSKGKAIWKKDVNRGLELAETLTEKRTREYKARTSKAESEAFEAKQKVREVTRDE